MGQTKKQSNNYRKQSNATGKEIGNIPSVSSNEDEAWICLSVILLLKKGEVKN